MLKIIIIHYYLLLFILLLFYTDWKHLKHNIDGMLLLPFLKHSIGKYRINKPKSGIARYF
jgi:hypothetical protein